MHYGLVYCQVSVPSIQVWFDLAGGESKEKVEDPQQLHH